MAIFVAEAPRIASWTPADMVSSGVRRRVRAKTEWTRQTLASALGCARAAPLRNKAPRLRQLQHSSWLWRPSETKMRDTRCRPSLRSFPCTAERFMCRLCQAGGGLFSLRGCAARVQNPIRCMAENCKHANSWQAGPQASKVLLPSCKEGLDRDWSWVCRRAARVSCVPQLRQLIYTDAS